MKRAGLFVFLVAIVLRAQQSQPVNITPDCALFFSFTAVASSANFNNGVFGGAQPTGGGCTNWSITYTSRGFTGLSLQVESAPNAAGNVPGAFVAFAGTITTGINPNTSLTSASSSFSGYFPWLRVRLVSTVGAGQIYGVFYGSKTPPLSAFGSLTAQVEGRAADGAATVGNPVWVAGSDGANVRPFFVNLSNILGTAEALTPADAMANGGGGPINSVGGGTPLRVNVNPFVFNSATWDRLRGNTNGLFAQGNVAAGAANAGNPVSIGGVDDTAIRRQVIVDVNGGVTTRNDSGALGDGVSNTSTVDAGNAGAVIYKRTLPHLFNGSTWDRDFLCANRAAITLTAAGDTQIIAASGSTVVRICHISFASASAVDIKVTQGTGVNCATGPADLTGLYRAVTSVALDFQPTAALRSSASQAVCLNQSGAVNTGGVVIYAQY